MTAATAPKGLSLPSLMAGLDTYEVTASGEGLDFVRPDLPEGYSTRDTEFVHALFVPTWTAKGATFFVGLAEGETVKVTAVDDHNIEVETTFGTMTQKDAALVIFRRDIVTGDTVKALYATTDLYDA